MLWINRNMGCIEISAGVVSPRTASSINRNMGCIEISLFAPKKNFVRRLIETWDVLKYLMMIYFFRQRRINRNMGCIEIETSGTRTPDNLD